jgi:WD40 repeat protein/tRNA A-37 threonylcarbamoyl transferase component Bud32
MADTRARFPLSGESSQSGFPDRSFLDLFLADQRQSWQRGERVPVEDYSKRQPWIRADAEAMLQLIYNEVILREQQGEIPQLAEYLQRFPDLAEPLRLQFEVDQAIQSGQLFRSAFSQTDTISRPSNSSEGAAAEQISIPGYEILGELGQGGMGIVYRARQIKLRRLVALKMLRAGSLAPRETLTRFRIEAEAVARLQHPHIVQIYEVGEHAGRPYLALEYVEGGSLAERLVGSPLPAQQVAALLEVLARSMDYAHARGIVHRDLKPGNILLQTRGAADFGSPKITDFGLAKLLVGGDERQTLTGDILGTPSYMAPEQATGNTKEALPAADVYALGAILYELLTGRPPFRGENRLATLEQTRTQDPVPPRLLQPHLPQDLQTICLKCLQKEPSQRYASAGALAEDLSRYQAGKPILARPTSWVGRAGRWCHRNPAVAGLVGSVALLLVLITVGSVVAAVWLGYELRRAERAERAEKEARKEAIEKLWWSRLAQAKAIRSSRRGGQRFESLETVREAAQMAREQSMPDGRLQELRNEAIACLALPDLRPASQGNGWPSDGFSVDFDGSLERYARVNADGTAAICRVADDKEIAHLPGLGSSAWPLLSPDGRFLALRREAGPRLQVWKLAGPEPRAVIDEPTGVTADFSRDSRKLALGHRDGRISWHDLDSGQRLCELAVGSLPEHLAVHPNQREVAVCVGAGVQIRSLETGELLAELDHGIGLNFVVWHPAGQELAVVGDDHRIHLWNVPARRRITVLESQNSGGIKLAFSHSGELLASAGWDGILRLWDTRTGKQIFSTQAAVACLRFRPDDRRLAAAIRGNQLELWEVAVSREYQTLVRPLIFGSQRPHSCAFGPDGRLLAAGMPDGVAFWDLTRKTPLAFTPLNFAGWILFDATGALLSNGGDGVLRWPVRAGAITTNLQIGPPTKLPLPGSACQIAQSRDSHVLAIACQEYGGVVLHAERPNHPPHPTFSPAGGEGRVRVIRLAHEDLRYIAVHPEGRLVATGSHGRSPLVKVWEANSGRLVKELPAHGGSSVNFSPDGRWLATGGGGGRLWEVDSWREGIDLGGVSGTILVAFSADSKLLAAGTGSGVIRLVDPNTGTEYARLEDPDQDRANWIGFSPDGTRLVTTNYNRELVHVWNLGLIREELAALGLDWNLPSYPPAQNQDARPLQMVLDRGSLPGDPRLDLIEYSLAIAFNPINPEAYFRRGRAYGRLQERKKAIADYTLFLSLAPPDDKRRAEVLFRRSNNHYGLNERAGWRADLCQMAQLHLDGIPEIHDAIARQFNDLAWELVTGAENARDPAQALLLAKRAVELRPDDWRYRNTLGVAQYRTGRYQAAIESLARSLRESEGRYAAHELFFLALCHARRGEAAEARGYYERALEWQQKQNNRLPAEIKKELDAVRAEVAEMFQPILVPEKKS